MGRMRGLCHQDAIALVCDCHRVYQSIHYRNVEGA